MTDGNVLHDDAERKHAEEWVRSRIRRAQIVGPFAEEASLTVAVATVLADLNPGNRPLLAKRVRDYADAIRAGEWEMNGESIIVSADGLLNDGQHRVHAVIESGRPITTMITFGVSRDSRKTVDIGAKRTSGHVLGMEGVKNASIISAATRFVLNYESKIALGTHRRSGEISRFYHEHEGISASVPAGEAVNRSLAGNPSMWVALHFLMSRSGIEKANQFFGMLESGVGINDKSHPVAQLRARLLDDLRAKAKLPLQELAAISIKAMNAFIDGKPVKVLRWTRGGDAPEQFPRFRT